VIGRALSGSRRREFNDLGMLRDDAWESSGAAVGAKINLLAGKAVSAAVARGLDSRLRCSICCACTIILAGPLALDSRAASVSPTSTRNFAVASQVRQFRLRRCHFPAFRRSTFN